MIACQATPSVTVADASPRGDASDSALVVRNLCKSFQRGRIPVLTGISFTVKRGERLAIIGANGSGKSTLLRCCMHLLSIDAGEVEVGGLNLQRLRGRERRRARARIGMVFQKHNLQPRLSVLTNVIHGALARGHGLRVWRDQWAPRQERLEAIRCLDMVGLADLANRRASELSGGQSQRVAIARCLMQDSAIILADEPAASLDPAAGEEVMEMFHRISRQRGITLVVVSHDMEHAQRYADRIIGLKSGAIALDGPSATFNTDELRSFFA